METTKGKLSGKRAIVEPNGVKKLGLMDSSATYMGYLWPCIIQGHFGAFGG